MKYKTLAFILGFTCFIVQLVLIREFLNLFMGNELVIGVMLALWMLITATGAVLGRYVYKKDKNKLSIFLLLFLLGIFPIAGALFSVWLRSMLYAPGVMISLQGIILLSMAGLAAFCLVSGMMFTLLASATFPENQKNNISRIYAFESLGSFVGGIIFYSILVYNLNSMQILRLVLILNLLIAIWYASRQKKIIASIIGISVSMSLIISIFLMDLDIQVSKMLYPDQELLLSKDTPFGKLVVTEKAGQHNFFISGNPILISDDIIDREEKVHYAMCLHPSPKNVLMLSGGLDGSGDEVLKYNIEHFDYVDNDVWSMEAAEHFNGLQWPPAIHIVTTSPRSFLQETDQMYDVIILNSAPPSTIGNNRFYTNDFFQKMKSRLHKQGLMSIHLPAAGNYLDVETALLYSTIFNTLKNNFLHTRLIPGNNTYFISSDEPLSGNITEMISDKGISTSYVNRYYLDDQLTDERAGQMVEALDIEAQINTDAHPLAAFLSTLRWLGMFQIPPWLVALIPMIIMIIIVMRLSPFNIGLFASGFTASAAEFLLLVSLQMVYGFIYQMAGIVIMSFMAGLAAGAAFLHTFFSENKKAFIRIQMILGIFVGVLPLLLIGLGNISYSLLPAALICFFTFIAAALLGIQYRLASRLKSGSLAKVASSSYGADLAGAAFGMFFVAVFIFPLIGMIYTGLLLAWVNFMAVG